MISEKSRAFGRWLREERYHRNITQEELGAMIGICGEMVCRIERGCKEASDNIISSVAKLFGIPVDETLILPVRERVSYQTVGQLRRIRYFEMKKGGVEDV